MEKNITLIITMHNQKGELQIALKWLKQVESIHKIILVDNGSQDGTAEILAETGYDYIVFDEGRQGYGVVWNAIVDNFDLDETIVFAEAQFLPGIKCLQKLSEAVVIEGHGIAGARWSQSYGMQYVPADSVKQMLEIENLLGQSGEDKYATVIGVESGLWAISRKTLVQMGRFEEKLLKPENVLMDYQLKMLQAGYHAVVCKEAVAFGLCIHKIADVFTEEENQKDREILKARWNMNYFNTSSNSSLVNMITEEKNAEIHVLEVGCDLGATLLEVQSKFPKSKTYGLEINPSAVNIAKHLTNVREGNIEEEDVPFQQKFDYIIFGDVLEHLQDPHKTIRFCRQKLLKENGCIIASIPNLMHISVMQSLLRGRFEYTDMGLLDRTHIHFFTYYEILSMFQTEGYVVESIGMTNVDITEEQEELKRKLLEISENVESHMYEAFQYSLKARKKSFS